MIEKRGRQLTPGERVRVWIDNLLKVWPILLFLMGASAYNLEPVRNAIHGNLIPEGQVVTPENGASPQVLQALESMKLQIDQNTKARELILEKTKQDDTSLQSQIDDLKERLGVK